MPKTKYQKIWEQKNKHKIAEYRTQYMKDKTQASIVLETWVKEEIDRVKIPEQSYGNWIRLLVEDWARKQRTIGQEL